MTITQETGAHRGAGARAPEQWEVVDTGWGRCAAEMATSHEAQNVREYVALHQRLGVGVGDRLLDVACGAGLAFELATARGATGAGIDASPRLVAVARDRSPEADLRVGDMRALPWADAAFDVVTSFRGIWATTPEVLDEVLRVLRPGGRFGMTVWGHLKASSGAWALRPFGWADAAAVAHQGAMTGLGRPGVGEAVLAEHGFTDVERVRVPFAWEFADPESFARALASTGPAWEAIEAVGEARFLRDAAELARAHLREGMPLRAEIDVVGFLARAPHAARADLPDPAPEPGTAFLPPPSVPSQSVRAQYEEDLAELGFVMNASRLWAHQQDAHDGLFALMGQLSGAAGLTVRDRGILVTAMAATLGDSYCALAWGGRLAAAADPELSASVLRGDDAGLDGRERVLARWARRVTADPNATTSGDVAELRAAGFDDAGILAVTAYVGLRIAFSTVNDALGARPDPELADRLPASVLASVVRGRPPSRRPGPGAVAGGTD